MYVSQDTIDANIRVSQFKVDVLELAYEKGRGLTQAEYEYALTDLLNDQAQRKFGREKKRRDKRKGFDLNG